MIQIILLEMITIISLLFSLLLLYVSFAPAYEMLLLFAWMIAASMVFVISSNKFRIFDLTILLLLVPLYFFESLVAVAFILVTPIVVYLYAKSSLLRGSRVDYVQNLKKAFMIFIAAVLIKTFLDEELTGSIAYAVPYLIAYLLASVILIRSIRHIDSGMDPKTINKANAHYIAIMSIVAALATLEDLRAFFLSLAVNFYRIFGYGIVTVITAIVGLFNDTSEYTGDEEIASDPVLDLPSGQRPEDIVGEEQLFLDLSWLEIIVTVILVLAIGYMLFRAISKGGRKIYGALEFTEEREFIIGTKKNRKFFAFDRYPSEMQNQIRYYYRKYLAKLSKKQVEISKSDTSLEVNQKAEGFFAGGIDKIRSIYIDSRYGNKDVNENTVQKIKDLYREL